MSHNNPQTMVSSSLDIRAPTAAAPNTNGASNTHTDALSKLQTVPNLLEGPLSPIASTRFRQLLARPGIIVR